MRKAKKPVFFSRETEFRLTATRNFVSRVPKRKKSKQNCWDRNRDFVMDVGGNLSRKVVKNREMAFDYYKEKTNVDLIKLLIVQFCNP